MIDDFIKQLVPTPLSRSMPICSMFLPPAEADVQAYYQGHLDRFREPDRVRVDEIRVSAKDKADRALAALRRGGVCPGRL